MRQKIRKGRLLLVFLLAVCVMVCIGIGWKAEEAKASVKPSGAPEMEVSYGFQDMAKGDRYLKISIRLDNQGNNEFSGMLKFLTTESSQEVYHYEYPVALAADSCESEEYYIPLGIKAEAIYVSLCDRSNTEVLRKRIKLNISRDISECLIGVFSKDPEALEYMDELGIHYGAVKTRLIPLDQETAPDNALGYDQLDLVVVSDYDLNRISEQQHQALSQWIDQGGTLLAGGGLHYRKNLGRFASELLEWPYSPAKRVDVNLGMEYAQNAPQDSVLSLMCADINLKNGSTLLPGEGFPLLSYTHQKNGRVVAAAFSLEEIGSFCEKRPAFLEKLFTKTFGEVKMNELSQPEYFGFSSLYFSVQGLINTGDTGRLPNVVLYTVVIVVYLVLIGPGMYLYLKKKGIHRYYMAGVALCGVLFTGIIYVMGIGTRFREPFFTYASIIDTSGEQAQEETYINIRSPYNKPYTIHLDPSYTVRPVTKSYYYDVITKQQFTGTEDYKIALRFLPEETEVRVRDTVAFTPKLFYLSRMREQTRGLQTEGKAGLFDGEVSGTIVNQSEETLENAVLLLYGKAVALGDIEPGQKVDLSTLPVYNYPLNYPYALARKMTGADQYQNSDIGNKEYEKAQERSRLLAFYMQSNLSEYFSGGKLLAFVQNEAGQTFLAEKGQDADGLTMLTSEIEWNREKNGVLCRPVLEEEPQVISGSYMSNYNSIYIGEPADPVILEYSLGSDLTLQKVYFEEVSSEFLTGEYSYLSAFRGEMYFYNYDTGRNDLIEQKESFTAAELEPYLSPANTLMVKYVSAGNEENGWEACLPMIYAVGEVK